MCYFYPLNYSYENDSFTVFKHEICSGIFDGEFSEWKNISEKFEEYEKNCEWHNEIVAFWNKYYGQKSDYKDFIIFFYESLYPIYLKKKLNKVI